LRTRILLHGALAALAVVLVMAASASADNFKPNISPTGTFTATASNIVISWPGNEHHSESTINCKSTTISGLVHASEGVGNAVTGYEPPTVKECEVHDSVVPAPGIARFTATVPVEKFTYQLKEPNPGLFMTVIGPKFHVHTEQPLGFDCDFELRQNLSETISQGHAPFVLSELALTGTLVSTNATGLCGELFGQTPKVSWAYKLSHPLTVSSSG
jgi:hypothetical protein